MLAAFLHISTANTVWSLEHLFVKRGHRASQAIHPPAEARGFLAHVV
jgi:hypothetical protein